jgi:VanZ family protein
MPSSKASPVERRCTNEKVTMFSHAVLRRKGLGPKPLRPFFPRVVFGHFGARSRLSSDRHQVLKAWIATILWLIVIAIESSAMLSAHNTSRILYPLLHALFGLNWESFEHWHFYIRKGGHVFGYGMLSFLLFRSWRATLPAFENIRWRSYWATMAILGTALVASLDEWHQSFIPSRTGRWQDVVLDTCAGVAAQIFVLLAVKSANRLHRNRL